MPDIKMDEMRSILTGYTVDAIKNKLRNSNLKDFIKLSQKKVELINDIIKFLESLDNIDIDELETQPMETPEVQRPIKKTKQEKMDIIADVKGRLKIRMEKRRLDKEKDKIERTDDLIKELNKIKSDKDATDKAVSSAKEEIAKLKEKRDEKIVRFRAERDELEKAEAEFIENEREKVKREKLRIKYLNNKYGDDYIASLHYDSEFPKDYEIKYKDPRKPKSNIIYFSQDGGFRTRLTEEQKEAKAKIMGDTMTQSQYELLRKKESMKRFQEKKKEESKKRTEAKREAEYAELTDKEKEIRAKQKVYRDRRKEETGYTTGRK